MKVVDAMSKHVDFVSEDTKVEKLALLIFGRGINGVPVCRGKKVVGFVTERDILAKFYPTISEYVEDPFHSSDFEGMEAKVREIFEMNTDQIMSQNPTTVTPQTPLLRAQSLMFIEKVGRLPVVDEKGSLVGIIAKGDIFRALVGDKLLFTEDENYNDWLSKTYYASVDNKNRLEHESPDLVRLFKENNVRSIIDIGCGTGDHSIEFAKKGFKMVGIDRSKGMILESNRKRQSISKDAKDRVKFYCGNLEGEMSALKREFDAAIFMGNTIPHNPHRYQKVIKKAAELLSEKGIMVFQITNFERVVKAKKRLLSFNFARLEDEPNKEYAFLEFYDKPNQKDSTILKSFAIFISDGKRWKSSGVRNTLMAHITKENIAKTLQENGFSKISFYGGSFEGKEWDYLFRKPFDPLNSDWLNVVAKR
ncbi:MAG: hypothetical protein A3C22_01030 [Candidatus Levybacteria bacterium RIFCSPHIGHO2_02_FULL_37_10]|nr:MAG: hypothetical protein A3C22_01030 [Candidatus Levybacteria bacterium RIFCSPHIGHO2_02_FULL_37_10]